MKRLRAAVAGLGRIGMGYDYTNPDPKVVLTHAKAFARHWGFDLVAGCDPDPQAGRLFTDRYRVPAYTDIESMMQLHAPDVVALCTPTQAHDTAFFQVLPFRPVAVICEKPLAATLSRAEAMAEATKSAGILTAINYQRRFDPGVNAIRQSLASGEMGEPFKAVVQYGKGFMHNGSHFVDLMCYLFGPPSQRKVLAPGRCVPPGDAEPDVRIVFGSTPVYFLAAREECYSLAEVEILTTLGRLTLAAGGVHLSWWPAVPDPLFPGYTILSQKPRKVRNGLSRSVWHVADAVYQAVCNGKALASTAQTALVTQTEVEGVLTQARSIS